MTTFTRLVDVIRALRDPTHGCPWDLAQNHRTLRPFLLEEAYEVLEAIDTGNDRALCEELGDVLLQVVLHAQLATERQAFSIEDVSREITEKMVRRHPHVFGDAKVEGVDQVLENWHLLKKQEKGTDEPAGTLGGIPKSAPALLRAQRMGEKAARVAFDWASLGEVMAKVSEELEELRVELTRFERSESNQMELEHEFGDVLFALCQLARWLKLDAENCLREAASRFELRFNLMERDAPSPLSGVSPEELDRLWNEAKAKLSLADDKQQS